jgi:hypothetical protein
MTCVAATFPTFLAATLAEQNRNVQRWFALRRQRGEM